MNYKDKKIVFAGPVTTVSGYGARSRDICRALIDLGCDLEIIPLQWGTTPTNALDTNSTGKDAEILKRFVSPNLTYKPDIFIHCTIPNEFQAGGHINIGITAGIETDLCAPEWIEGCNRMNLVLVSSTHSKSVFEKSSFNKLNENKEVIEVLKLTTPCEVLIEGVDINTYTNDVATNSTLLENVKSKSNFLFVGHWLQGELGSDRKDVASMIITFLNTFKNYEPNTQPGLILKTSSAGFSIPETNEIKKKIRQCKKIATDDGFTGKLPDIYLITGHLTDAEMNELYNDPKVTAMVSFTKGEGYGRPLAEFSLTGKPIIASNWSGQLDFLNKKSTTLIPGVVSEVHASAVNQWIIKDSKWFTINYNLAGKKMHELITNPILFTHPAQYQRDHILNGFTYNHMIEQIDNHFTKFEEYHAKSSTPIENPISLKDII